MDDAKRSWRIERVARDPLGTGDPVANRTKFTTNARAKFLEVLSETSSVTDAAQAIGMSRRGVYNVRERDPDLASAWDDAVEVAIDALEREARRRAYEGFDEPVFYKGVQVGTMRRYSDRMLELLLRAHRPDKYRETVRQQQAEGH